MFPITQSPISNQTRNFRRDERGSIAIIFGLTVTAVCLFSGLAIDVGRAYSSKAKLGQAADAAVLAAVKGMRLEGMTDQDASDLARRVFDQNMVGGSGNWTDIRTFSVTIDRATNTATINAVSAMRTAFAGLAGIQELSIPTQATAQLDSSNLEISLQLDLTGSMCYNPGVPCTNDRKIRGLKDATKDLVDILIPDVAGPSTVRVAFAPFTAGVNLGSYQSAVTGGITTADKCVYERLFETNQATDVSPVGNDRYMVRADLLAAPLPGVVDRATCPNAPVVPLTADKVLLKTTVEGYVAHGSTGGHNGTAWAWNMISPTFAAAPTVQPVWPAASVPAAYDDTSTSKVAILMTDGEYNTKFGRNWDGSPVAVETCTAMKAAGIRVYTVGFELGGNPTAINTLSTCASSAGDFYEASNADELRQAFRSIANNIVRLRLTN